MKKVIASAFAMAMIVPLWAAEPPGFFRWSGAQLKEYALTLAPKIDQSKSAVAQLANLGDHTVQVNYREASGEGELHVNFSDVIVVQVGEAKLEIGGTMVNERTSAPGELRAASLAGAEQRDLAPGDVVNIPAGTPHRILLDSGKKFTYMVVKIKATPK